GDGTQIIHYLPQDGSPARVITVPVPGNADNIALNVEYSDGTKETYFNDGTEKIYFKNSTPLDISSDQVVIVNSAGIAVNSTDASGNNYTEMYGENGTLLSRTTTERLTNGYMREITTNYSGEGEGYDSRIMTIYNGDGMALQSQIAITNTLNDITEIQNYYMGQLTASGVIQGIATDDQLLQESNMALQAQELLGFSEIKAGVTSDPLLQTLGVDNTQTLSTALQRTNANYSGNNVAENISFESNNAYGAWLEQQFNDAVTTVQSVFREFLTTTALTSKADPYLISLQNGPLAVKLALENPTTLNILSALKEVILAGGVLSETFKQGMATILGTNIDGVNMLVAEGGSTLISILAAYENPTPLKIASALQQTLSAGVTIDRPMVETTAKSLGVDMGTVDKMLAYGGAALAVISMLKDPSTQNIIISTQQTVNLLAKVQTIPALHEQLGYISTGLNNVMVIYNLYNYVKHPDNVSAVNALLTVGMQVAPEYAVPLAAVLTIGELVAPKFTNEVVNDLGAGINIINDFTQFLWTGTGDIAHSVEKAVRNFFHHCPLVLNLAGNDVWTTNLTAFSPTFDMNATGTKIQTGWITPDEGFLVRDRNGNGIIDDATELFSDKTSSTATTGFGALSELDSNHDNVIDISDSEFGTLKIWVDKNSDGISQEDELYTLAELGIASINLSVVHGFNYNNENIITDTSTFMYTDGSKGQIADAVFATKDPQTPSLADNLITMGGNSTTVRLANGQTIQIIKASDNSNVAVTNEGVNLITVNGKNNIIRLGETDDSIIVGSNTVYGGKGNDTYYIDSTANQVVIENANEGSDTVVSSISYVIGNNIENLTLTGTGNINATGNDLNNILTGNSAVNILNGGAGNDLLDGQAGADTMI
ncbi:MAG: calcium-binding protein, partial [Nitrospira sp.]|nr:calcium-binding protein [Nitrospira sp.]